MGEEESVKVAVRMRLFNGREKNAGASRIVRMTQEDKGSKTFIMNPDTQEERHFSFDYSFQTHSADEKGIGDYADQNTVFNLLGKPVLYTALEGRNVCLFAYGQTGAGKSFSMLGKAEPKEMQGIIPRSCLEIFRLRDTEKDDPLIAYNVSIQVVEIYCEMINDLLSDRKVWPPNGHKARLTKDGYVVDTVTRPCFDYDDIESAFTFADKNRSVGSHALNPESSRAHTIYCINYERKKKTSADAKMCETITARINLVDLAGSERSESAGTSGQMLKEGNAINLSLTALGSTIKALSEGKRPNFRDSKLTLLLQGSMTNGKVIMIAAVSPASICYDESMSTLRFAERIKMVKIKAKKNITEDPVAEIKKEMEEMRKRMQEEIDQLKALAGGDVAAMAGAGEDELAKKLEEMKQAEEDLKKELQMQQQNVNKTDDDRRREAKAITAGWTKALGGAALEKAEDLKEPHFRNLNEDLRLAETLNYKLKEGDTWIGKRDKDEPPDIEFNGMGMVKKHCLVQWDTEAKTVNLTPAEGSETKVNGKKQTGKVELKHNHRVWLGNNYAFRFVFPGEESSGDFQSEPLPENMYIFAAEEIQQDEAMGGQTKLGHMLTEALKKVEQANMIAQDIGQEVSFQPKIVKNRITGDDNVVVFASMPGAECSWPWEKFCNRLVDMVRMWQQWQVAQENEQEFDVPVDESSPFVDREEQLIGESDIWLQSLSNMIEHEADAAILAPTGISMGKLGIEINPLDAEGGEGPWEDDREDLDPFVDSAAELLHKDIQFVVKIKNINFAAEAFGEGASKYEGIWVRYKFNMNDMSEQWTQTEKSPSAGLEHKYAFKKKHEQFVDKSICHLIEKGRVTFQVWGTMVVSDAEKQKRGGGGRAQEMVNEIAAKQAELIKLLGENGVKAPAATGLPDGWSVVLAFKNDADGTLAYTLPPG